MKTDFEILRDRALDVIETSKKALESIKDDSLVVVEVGAYTYNDELIGRLETTMTPKLYTLSQFHEIHDGEMFEAKVQGRYKQVYPSYKKVSHWYKTQIIDAEAILTSLKNRNLI